MGGVTFKNAGECVSFAAQGGYIPGVTACVADGTTGCLTFDNATLPAEFGDTTITLNGSISFSEVCPSPGSNGECYFSLPNSLALGAGTYVVKDSSGTVTSHGTFQVADTRGTLEGLSIVDYLDASGNPTSSCSNATSNRVVEVSVTLTDSSGGTSGAILEGYQAAPSLAAGGVAETTTADYDGVSSGITISC
jgi:hypothetical protein